MSDSWKTPVFFVLAVLLIALASYFAGRVKGRRIGWERGWQAGYEAGWVAPHPADTTERRDTIYLDRPVPSSSVPAGMELLPIGTLAQVQARLDSLAAVRPDTAFVEVPVQVEARTYEGEDYRAQVSGWRPSLDWIEVYPKTITITPETPPAKQAARLGFGAAIGGAVVVSRQGVSVGPGAAVGLYVRF